jgi:hypothetical protein
MEEHIRPDLDGEKKSGTYGRSIPREEVRRRPEVLVYARAAPYTETTI